MTISYNKKCELEEVQHRQTTDQSQEVANCWSTRGGGGAPDLHNNKKTRQDNKRKGIIKIAVPPRDSRGAIQGREGGGGGFQKNQTSAMGGGVLRRAQTAWGTNSRKMWGGEPRTTSNAEKKTVISWRVVQNRKPLRKGKTGRNRDANETNKGQ